MKPTQVSLLLWAIALLLPARGIAQWQFDGNDISTATNFQFRPVVVSDGAGGAIVTWFDLRSGSSYDIYAQRVSASGVPQWTANGVAICTAPNNQNSSTLVPDGAGGAIITWGDPRSGNYHIYAQRVNASGIPLWTADGVALCTAANYQLNPTIVSDGAGGAIVTWHDYRGSSDYDVYAQRVNASGVPQWTANGVALCTAAYQQYNPTIVADGAGGAIVTWSDVRSGSDFDIYAQRVNAAGAVQWLMDGVAVCTAPDQQQYPMIVPNQSGGAIMVWEDLRDGSNSHIYAQGLGADGLP